jgi:lysozyme
MNISQVGIDLIKKFEGCVLHEYKDAGGVPTIGWGHTGGITPNQKITQAQADVLLNTDLKKFVDGVNGCVKVPINQNQFDSLVAFAFNLGIGCLQKSDLLTYINKKDFAHAANEFPRFCHAGGEILQGLVNRRAAEKALFLKPVPVPPKPVVKPAVKKYASLVDYLNAHKIASDFHSRAYLASSRGIHNYTGTAEQNIKLLNMLQKEKKKPTLRSGFCRTNQVLF